MLLIFSVNIILYIIWYTITGMAKEGTFFLIVAAQLMTAKTGSDRWKTFYVAQN